MNVLELAGVSIVRDGSVLLDDVDWTIDEDERWVVLGPNGAGKTTLLQVAAGRLHPTRGVAAVLGELLGTVDVFELRPRIGLASAALAERLPLGERVGDVVVTASYGMVGRALMTDPELMLLDEPAAGLDLGGREDLVHRLGELADDDAAPALVLVTHHVEEIPPGFTHALLLRSGRVVASGPLEQALTAETLGEAFAMPLTVERHGHRWTARAFG